MTIKIEITAKQLNAVAYALKYLSTFTSVSRSEKVARSVLNKVSIKFLKKQVEVQHKVNLFTEKKLYSFSLEYVEAHFLDEFLLTMINYPLSDYDRNVLRFVHTTLDQKLTKCI